MLENIFFKEELFNFASSRNAAVLKGLLY